MRLYSILRENLEEETKEISGLVRGCSNVQVIVEGGGVNNDRKNKTIKRLIAPHRPPPGSLY